MLQPTQQGSVYLARPRDSDLVGSRPYLAVKVIEAKYLELILPGEAVHEDPLREIQLMTMPTIRHANLVHALDVLRDRSGNMYILTEQAECDLLEYINLNHELDESEARVILSQVVSALLHLHSHGIMHLDVSLENILLFEQAQVAKVSDFGLSQEIASASNQNQCYMGKALYTAPEYFFDSRAPSVLADSFSLGVVLFAMVFGRLPYVALTNETMEFVQIAYGDMQELWTALESEIEDIGISKGCVDLMSHMLCAEKDRWSMEQISQHPWFTSSTVVR